MSKNSKIIMWAVIIIVIVLLGWWYFESSSLPAPQNGVNSAPVSAQTPQSQTSSAMNGSAAMGSSANSVPVSGLTTSPNDSSNAALNADMSSIDTQQGGLSGDSSNINQSMNSTN